MRKNSHIEEQDMADNLNLERTRFTELRRRLNEIYPDLDNQTLNDTLEGATNFKEALSASSAPP